MKIQPNNTLINVYNYAGAKFTFKTMGVFLTLCILKCGFAQQSVPQSLSKNDKLTAGFFALHTGLNMAYLHLSGIDKYNSKKPYWMDKIVPNSLNSTIAHASDGTAISSMALLGLSLLQTIKTKDYDVSKRMISNTWACYNITETIKNVAKVTRPYTQTQGIVKKEDIRSFLSGHSSLTACAATNLWMYKQDKVWMPITATALCAGTAIMRIKAGKHYTSDVLAGLLLGIAIPVINNKIKKI